VNKPTITRLIKENFEMLRERDLGGLSKKLAQSISWLIATTTDGFLRWALYQAPVCVMPPEPETTIFAAEDGKVYVNPPFWNAVVDLAQELHRDWADELRFALLHEVAHLLLRHPWEFRGLVSETFLTAYDIEPQAARQWANACMDYMVNNFCSDVLPRADLIKSLTISSSHDLEQFIRRSGADFPSHLKEDLETKHYSRFSWKDLFLAIVEGNKGFVLPPEAKRLNSKTDFLDNQHQTPAPITRAKGVHGELVPEDALIVRPGLDQLEDNPEESWSRAMKIAVVEARQSKKAGDQPGGHLLLLEQACSVTIPWDTLVRRELANTLNSTRVISSWSRPSRKLDEYPGVLHEGDPATMWLLADTSGSMRDQLELITGTALSYFQWLACPGEIKIIPWDASAYAEITVKSQADLRQLREIPGGGGTVINPALDQVLQKLEQGQLVVVCTDSCIDDLETPGFKQKMVRIHKVSGNNVLWLNFGSPSDAKVVENLPGVKVVHRRNSANAYGH